MKKTIITIAIVLGIAITTFGQGGRQNTGLFGRAPQSHSGSVTLREGDDPTSPLMPGGHYSEGDQNAVNTPLGSGVALLIGLGAAYAIGKKRKK